MGTKQLGIATYFHGRRHILDRLKKIYKRGKTSDSTVLIVEGISGSGKTALMHQVAIEAAKHGWNPINVGGAVSDARSLASDLHGVTAHSRRALVVKIGRHTFIFGKDLGYAERQLDELRAALTAGDYQWNDVKIKEMTAAKAGLYLWRLENKSNESLEYINGVLTTKDYHSLFDRMKSTMETVLPSQFPEFQVK